MPHYRPRSIADISYKGAFLSEAALIARHPNGSGIDSWWAEVAEQRYTYDGVTGEWFSARLNPQRDGAFDFSGNTLPTSATVANRPGQSLATSEYVVAGMAGNIPGLKGAEEIDVGDIIRITGDPAVPSGWTNQGQKRLSVTAADLRATLIQLLMDEPTLVIRSIPSRDDAVGGVDRQVYFVDNALNPNESGVYANSDERGLSKISSQS